MENTPPFLQRLNLDLNADESTIKRAYARELKKIDQATDLEGFQALRQAYEMARAWLERKRTSEEHKLSSEDEIALAHSELMAPSNSNSVPLPDASPGSTEKSGQQTFSVDSESRTAESNAENLKREHARRLAHVSALFEKCISEFIRLESQKASADEWEVLIHRYLRDETLLNFEAKNYFEWNILKFLLQGWMPGNEQLFIAARRIFNWDEGRKHLLGFGNEGRVMNRVIDEGNFFERFPKRKKEFQLQAIRRLRQAPNPHFADVKQYLSTLKTLQANYPYWMMVIAPVERIREWEAIRFSSEDISIDESIVTPDVRRMPSLGKTISRVAFLLIALGIGFYAFYITPVSQKAKQLELQRQIQALRAAERKALIEKNTQPIVQVIPVKSNPYQGQTSVNLLNVPFATRTFWQKLEPYLRKSTWEALKVKAGGSYLICLDNENNIDAVIVLKKADIPGFEREFVDALKARQPFGNNIPKKFGVVLAPEVF